MDPSKSHKRRRLNSGPDASSINQANHTYQWGRDFGTVNQTKESAETDRQPRTAQPNGTHHARNASQASPGSARQFSHERSERYTTRLLPSPSPSDDNVTTIMDNFTAPPPEANNQPAIMDSRQHSSPRIETESGLASAKLRVLSPTPTTAQQPRIPQAPLQHPSPRPLASRPGNTIQTQPTPAGPTVNYHVPKNILSSANQWTSLAGSLLAPSNGQRTPIVQSPQIPQGFSPAPAPITVQSYSPISRPESALRSSASDDSNPNTPRMNTQQGPRGRPPGVPAYPVESRVADQRSRSMISHNVPNGLRHTDQQAHTRRDSFTPIQQADTTPFLPSNAISQPYRQGPPPGPNPQLSQAPSVRRFRIPFDHGDLISAVNTQMLRISDSGQEISETGKIHVDLLYQAVQTDDIFYLVLNQLSCLKATNPEFLPESLQVVPEVSWVALESVFSRNIDRPLVKWMAHPQPPRGQPPRQPPQQQPRMPSQQISPVLQQGPTTAIFPPSYVRILPSQRQASPQVDAQNIRGYPRNQVPLPSQPSQRRHPSGSSESQHSRLVSGQPTEISANSRPQPSALRYALDQNSRHPPKQLDLARPKEQLYRYVSKLAFGPHRVNETLPMVKTELQVSKLEFDTIPQKCEPNNSATFELPTIPLQAGNQSYRLRCVVDKFGQPKKPWLACDTVWPKHIMFELNDVYLPPRRNEKKRHQPIDLTPYLKDGTNSFVTCIQLPSTDPCFKDPKLSRFAFAIETIIVTDHSSILNSIPTISAAESLDMIKKAINGQPSTSEATADDLQIVSTNLTISLLDPITATSIPKIPVRSKTCLHKNCFDLEMFLATRPRLENKPDYPTQVDVWQCPICRCDARPHLLVRDGFLDSVRARLGEMGRLDARAILIQPDGSWAVKEEDKVGTWSVSAGAGVGPGVKGEEGKGKGKEVEMEVIELDDD